MDPLEYYDRNIPCLAACPVHTNAGVYVAAIAEGMDREAYLTARLPNPFPSVCGRVCAAPCEDACRRGAIDEPIAIRALKRFVTEKYGVEAGLTHSWKVPGEGPMMERPESVAIVGGGPGGLAAAHDLRQWGYQVTVYEAAQSLGGMMRLGIPEYRLDRALLDAEIKAITDLGVSVRLGSRLGVQVTLDELRDAHDAVFLSFGATLGRGLDIPGHDADGVFRAIEFLININQGFRVDVGEKVVVVGGGNVAMDAARTALRASVYEQASRATTGSEVPSGESAAAFTEAVDVARSAIRAGAKDVTVISLESRAEMPAAGFEIEEAMTEGIHFVHRRGPLHVKVEEGAATGLATVGVLSVFDQTGRFNPVFDPRDVREFPADTVILAIGQAVDLGALGENGPEMTPRGTIETDPASGATSLEGVWAGGDAAYGPRNLIDAIANGRTAAASIHRSFGGEAIQPPIGQMVNFVDSRRTSDIYDRVQRVPVDSLPSDRRIGLREVEQVFTESQARAEASRCLRCFANIQLNAQLCVLCGLCVDVCPFDLISLVPASDIEPKHQRTTALFLDESRCIRCGLCIDRCPTNALSMSVWSGIGVLAIPDLEGANS
ncbi:MAG: FAD-dependent oxidoreductase [Acidimicrobiia bacterium]|nr:FAD-dependent oxidoreductase [Acidimicrobiia bacterium]